MINKEHVKLKKTLETEYKDKYERFLKMVEEARELSFDNNESYKLSCDIIKGQVCKIWFSNRKSV